MNKAFVVRFVDYHEIRDAADHYARALLEFNVIDKLEDLQWEEVTVGCGDGEPFEAETVGLYWTGDRPSDSEILDMMKSTLD